MQGLSGQDLSKEGSGKTRDTAGVRNDVSIKGKMEFGVALLRQSARFLKMRRILLFEVFEENNYGKTVQMVEDIVEWTQKKTEIQS